MDFFPRSFLYPFLSIFSALACSAQAGVPVNPVVPGSTNRPPLFNVELNSQFEFADETPAGPSGDVIRGQVALPLFFPLSKEWRLFGALRGGFTDYETDPFGGGGLQTWNVGGLLLLDRQLNDTWSTTFGVLGGASWEDGASFSDSLTGGGMAMAGYRFSPTLKVGLGALYGTRLNEDPMVVPALSLDWKVTEQFEVTLFGLDLRAESDLNAAWSVYLRGQFDPNGALLKNRKGFEADSFNDQGFRAAGGLKWTPAPSFSLAVEGGLAFHEYTLSNDREEILAKDRLDPAPFVGLTARLSF